jgi:hypothetical protein
MRAQEVITLRLKALIREVDERGADGRWQLRLGLQDLVSYAEFIMRPLGQARVSTETLQSALLMVKPCWKEAMCSLFPDPAERNAMEQQFAHWVQQSHEVSEGDVDTYLDSIARNLSVRRSLAA